MPIQNLHGVARKNAKPINGHIFKEGLAATQHSITHVVGRSYNSPFTASPGSVFPQGATVTTQPALPALQVESPGKLAQTGLHRTVDATLPKFTKIHPSEKGSHFATASMVRAIVRPTGGPSKTFDTPTTPNKVRLSVRRPPRVMPKMKPEVTTNLSYLRSGGTLSSHGNQDKSVSRWHVTKKGAVE